MHYHIKWSGGRYDWERFRSFDEATKAAMLIVQPNETFIVQHFDDKCSVCEKLQSASRGTSRKRDDSSGPASGGEK
jgi:hypothetical protein